MKLMLSYLLNLLSLLYLIAALDVVADCDAVHLVEEGGEDVLLDAAAFAVSGAHKRIYRYRHNNSVLIPSFKDCLTYFVNEEHSR